jgi:pimeloyl-ACP methyl ester carboxylesterase
MFFLLAVGGLESQSEPHRNVQRNGDLLRQPHLRLTPCYLPKLKGSALCGKYEVFEDREAKAGRKLALNILLLSAFSAKPAPDPVFFLAGGPGEGAASEANNAEPDYLAEIRAAHDIVFVDLRGTGQSNPLNCNLYGADDDMRGYFGELFPLDRVRACKTQLEKIARLTLYTTPIEMNDLDEIRAALGYELINLYGKSYGTTAALVYLRQHPEYVRSVVLEGVAGPAFKLPLPFAKGAQHALGGLIADCTADTTCHGKFPHFKREFAAVLARLGKGPISIQLTEPATRKPQRVSLTRGAFVERVRLMLYIADLASTLPFLIHKAYQQDYVPFGMVAVALSRILGNSIATGEYFSVTCAEDIPFIADAEIARETAGTFLGDYRVRTHKRACREWPRGDVPRHFTAPVRSDVPVLMISGARDPATPAQFGAAAAHHLPNSHQVIIPYGAHFAGSACVAAIVAEFISKGSARGVATSCVDQIRWPPFATELPEWLRQQ